MYSFLLWIGLLCLGTGTFSLITQIADIKKGEVAVATVVDLKASKDSDGGTAYAPVFVYFTHTQEKRFYEYAIYSSPSDWSIGEKTKVIYQKDAGPILLTYFGSFGTEVILLSVALVCLTISIGYYWSRKFLNSLT